MWGGVVTKSRGILRKHPWTTEQIAILRREYPHKTCADVARLVGHSLSSTYQMAIRLKIGKSDAFKESAASGRLTAMSAAGFNHRFKRGHSSWNKGTGWTAGGRSIETRFRKGTMPHNTLSVGSYRLTKDGYLERKYAEAKGGPSKRWRSVHRLVWEAAHGPTPDGHVVVFKAGQRTAVLEEITLERLELVPRQELMKRNTLHRYPKEVVLAVQLRGALMRQINKRSKREDEDKRPA